MNRTKRILWGIFGLVISMIYKNNFALAMSYCTYRDVTPTKKDANGSDISKYSYKATIDLKDNYNRNVQKEITLCEFLSKVNINYYNNDLDFSNIYTQLNANGDNISQSKDNNSILKTYYKEAYSTLIDAINSVNDNNNAGAVFWESESFNDQHKEYLKKIHHIVNKFNPTNRTIFGVMPYNIYNTAIKGIKDANYCTTNAGQECVKTTCGKTDAKNSNQNIAATAVKFMRFPTESETTVDSQKFTLLIGPNDEPKEKEFDLLAIKLFACYGSSISIKQLEDKCLKLYSTGTSTEADCYIEQKTKQDSDETGTWKYVAVDTDNHEAGICYYNAEEEHCTANPENSECLSPTE